MKLRYVPPIILLLVESGFLLGLKWNYGLSPRKELEIWFLNRHPRAGDFRRVTITNFAVPEILLEDLGLSPPRLEGPKVCLLFEAFISTRHLLFLLPPARRRWSLESASTYMKISTRSIVPLFPHQNPRLIFFVKKFENFARTHILSVNYTRTFSWNMIRMSLKFNSKFVVCRNFITIFIESSFSICCLLRGMYYSMNDGKFSSETHAVFRYHSIHENIYFSILHFNTSKLVLLNLESLPSLNKINI